MFYDNMSRFVEPTSNAESIGGAKTESDAKLFRLDSQRAAVCKKVSAETLDKACKYADSFGLVPCTADDPQRAVGKIIGCGSDVLCSVKMTTLRSVNIESGGFVTTTSTATIYSAPHIGEWITRGGALNAISDNGDYYLIIVDGDKATLGVSYTHTSAVVKIVISNAARLEIQWYK